MRRRGRVVAIAVGGLLGALNLANSTLVTKSAEGFAPLRLFAALPGVEDRASDLAARVPIEGERDFLASLAVAALETTPMPAAFARAEAATARVPAGPERAALDARLRLAAGDADAAAALSVAAGDYAAAERALDALEARGERTAEMRGARAILRATQDAPLAREAHVAALWRATTLENYAADNAPNAAARAAHRRAALAYVRRELVLAPLSGQALLTAGYAALDLHARDEARGYFARARAADPASASAYVGLARVALADGDRAAAAAYARRAETIAPAQTDVAGLRRDL